MNWIKKKAGEVASFLRAQLAGAREMLAIGREGTTADDADGEAVAAELRAVRESIAAEKTLVTGGRPLQVIDLQAPDHWPLPRSGDKRGRHRTSVDNRVLVPSTQRTIPVVRTEGKPPWDAVEYPLVLQPSLDQPPEEPERQPGRDGHVHDDDGTVEGCPGCFTEPPEEHPWPSGMGLTGQFKAIDDYIGKLPDLGDDQE